MKKYSLSKELRSVGASKGEADDLAALAARLSHAAPRGLSSATKKRLAPAPEAAVQHHTGRWALAGSFAAICLLVLFAQSSLPGSWLYGIKRGAEEVRSFVQPGYVETMVTEREQEVEQLKADEASPEKIEKAERIYEETKERSEKRQKNSDNTESQHEERTQERKHRSRRNHQEDSNQNNSPWNSRNYSNDNDFRWW